MGRPESGPHPWIFPVVGVIIGYMLGWCIAIMIKDQPFEWIQGGFGTAGLQWGATAAPFCFISWAGAIVGGLFGYKVARLP